MGKKLFNLVINANMSIKSQVIIFVVVGFTLMNIIISLATSAGVNHQYKSLMLKNAEQITEGLAKRAIFPLLSGSEQNAQEAIEQVLGFEQVLSARILDEENHTFLATAAFPYERQVISNNVSQTTVILDSEEFWLIKSPIFILNEQLSSDENQFEAMPQSEDQNANEAAIGFAEVIFSKHHLNSAQFQIALLIACLGIVSVLVLSLMLKTGLQKALSPLNILADTMQQSRKSAEHIQAHISGAKEIRNMASAYNNMMQVLDKQDDDLKRHRDSLEEEVSLRTHELIIARDEALQASKHKSEFIANMSHELRTPIQAIIGYGELVIEELELLGEFELIEDMDKIETSSQRLLSMINSLLDLAKIESGKIDLHPVKVNLAELEKTILDTIAPIANKNQNTVSIDNQSQLESIFVDKEKLEQVLLNLLSNACKFSENDNISLNISATNSHIHFNIKDNGIGLSPIQQQYIFEEFRQVDASQSRKFSGTGLGLAISKRFVGMMNGEITVKSELGQGAEFTVRLPI